MRRSRFINAESLTLDGTINSSATTVNLTDATSLPSNGDYNITIENEIMLVTERTGNSLTVVRGQDDTLSAAHSTGSSVQVIATKTGMDKLIYDAGFICNANPKRLSVEAADFSWINQGTSSLSDNAWGGITMTTQNAGPQSLRVAYVSAPSEPWTFIAHVDIGPSAEGGPSGSHGGIILSDSGSSRLESMSIRPLDYSWFRWNSSTSFASTVGGHDLQIAPGGVWLRWVNNGTTIQPFASMDGENWFQMASALSKTAWLSTNGPDRIGFYYANHQLDGEKMNLNAWILT